MMKYAARLRLKCDHPSGYRLHFSGRIGDTFYGVGKAPTQGKNLTQAKLVEFAREKGWKFHRNDTQSCPSCVKEKRGIPKGYSMPDKPTPVPLPPHDWNDAPPNTTHWNSETNHYYRKTNDGGIQVFTGHVWSSSVVTSLDDLTFVERPGATTESRVT